MENHEKQFQSREIGKQVIQEIEIDFIITELIRFTDREFGIYDNITSFIRKLHAKRYLLIRPVYFTWHQFININVLSINTCLAAILFSI